MAIKGVLRYPALSLEMTHKDVMRKIADWDELVGVFIIGGELSFMRASTATFDKLVVRNKGNFIGLYDGSVKSDAVLDDLRDYFIANGPKTLKKVLFIVPEGIKNRLSERAKSNGVSVSAIVRRAVDEYFMRANA